MEAATTTRPGPGRPRQQQQVAGEPTGEERVPFGGTKTMEEKETSGVSSPKISCEEVCVVVEGGEEPSKAVASLSEDEDGDGDGDCGGDNNDDKVRKDRETAKRWLTTEEYLPSSCSSSDAEGDNESNHVDDDDDDDDENSFFRDGSSSSSDLSFLDDGDLEYVEYYKEDDRKEGRRRFVFLRMPPLPRDVVDDVVVDNSDYSDDKGDGDEGEGDEDIVSSIDEHLYREVLHVSSSQRPPILPPKNRSTRRRVTHKAPGPSSPPSSSSLDPAAARRSATVSSPPTHVHPKQPALGGRDSLSLPLPSPQRVPLETQAVFLEDQQGQEVNAPRSSSGVPKLSPPTPPPNKTTRIPMELQAVFVASQQGEVVDKPPTSGAAFRVFGRWFGRNKGNNHPKHPEPPKAATTIIPSGPAFSLRRPRPPQQQQRSPRKSSLSSSSSSSRIARFFRKQLSRKRAPAPQLPDISEHSGSSQDPSIVKNVDADAVPSELVRSGEVGFLSGKTFSSTAAAEAASRPTGGSAGSVPELLRASSLRSFGSSRRSGFGSLPSVPESVSSSRREGGDAPSRGSSSRYSNDPTTTNDDIEDDGCGGSSHSWDSEVSDLSSEDEALYQDLEQMLSQAKAQWPPNRTTTTTATTPAQSRPSRGSIPPPGDVYHRNIRQLHLEQKEASAASSLSFSPPTVAAFTSATRPVGARPLSSSQVNVYVPWASQDPQASPAPPSPTKSSPRRSTLTVESSEGSYEPIIPTFGTTVTKGSPNTLIEPMVPLNAKRNVGKDCPSPMLEKERVSEASSSSRPSLQQKPPTISPMLAPRSTRIPMELQEIFLRSNGGEDVENILPPSNGNAFRVFKRPPSIWPVMRRRPSRKSLMVSSSSKRRLSSRVLASILVAKGRPARSSDAAAATIERSQTGSTSLQDSRSSCVSSLVAAPQTTVPIRSRLRERSEISTKSTAPPKDIEYVPLVQVSVESAVALSVKNQTSPIRAEF